MDFFSLLFKHIHSSKKDIILRFNVSSNHVSNFLSLKKGDCIDIIGKMWRDDNDLNEIHIINIIIVRVQIAVEN